jgi:hypothetical protein
MKRFLISVASAAAACAVMLAIPAQAVSSARRPGTASHHRPEGCGRPLRASGRHSIESIAWTHDNGDIGGILIQTLKCYGGVFPTDLWATIDGADLHADLVKGTRLWIPPHKLHASRP